MSKTGKPASPVRAVRRALFRVEYQYRPLNRPGETKQLGTSSLGTTMILGRLRFQLPKLCDGHAPANTGSRGHAPTAPDALFAEITNDQRNGWAIRFAAARG